MTPPTGFVKARRTTGVVKVADRYLPEGVVIPGGIVGPGDIAVIGQHEAEDSDHWEVVVEEPVKSKTGGNG